MEKQREKVIVKTSVIGVITNALLSSLKAVVGFLTNSIAVVLDAINNLTDALSSIITIVGAKLASKKPDKKHPLGYGRIEYISAMVVSSLVLYAGISAGVESVKKIINPVSPEYNITSLILIGVAVLVKLILGRYAVSKGKSVDSSSLIASGKDAMFDAIISFSVLVSAIIQFAFGLSLEAYIGVIIALFIIRSGFEMLGETLSDIVGKRTESEVSSRVKELIMSEDEVLGAYDLFINNYGPNKDYASVHIEVDEHLTASEIDKLTRTIQAKVYKETKIILAGVSIYSYNTTDLEAANIRDDVKRIALSKEGVLEFHGFYIEKDIKEMRFDIVLSFDHDAKEIISSLYEEITNKYPEYKVVIVHDIDITD